MQPATLAVSMHRCALDDAGWCGVLEQRGCYGEARVPLAKSVVYAMGSVWRSMVDWIVVGVGVIVGNEDREMGVVV